jgi:3-oxoadipate enol-lactonase
MRTSGENLQITVNDLTVNYDDNGPVFAPAVVFIHGTPFNKSVWDLQAEALKSNYRVITYDLRGHGGTTGDNSRPLSIDLFTEDLVGLLDALELEKVMLCGSSMGGYIALNAVEKHAQRFNALVLTATQCAEDNEQTKHEREKVLDILRKKGIEKYSEQMIADLFAPTSFTTRKEEVRAVSRMIAETEPDVIIKTMNALSARRESCSNLWGINIPVLIMVGKEDVITPPDVAQFMRDNISGSVLQIIEYAGHLVNLENTHEYNQFFKKFIERVCQKKHLSRHCSDEVKNEKRSAVSKSH